MYFAVSVIIQALYKHCENQWQHSLAVPKSLGEHYNTGLTNYQ